MPAPLLKGEMGIPKTVTISRKQYADIQKVANLKKVSFSVALDMILRSKEPKQPEKIVVGIGELPPFWACLEE